MRSTADELAAEVLRGQKATLEVHQPVPVPTQTWFTAPRPLSEWIDDGKVVAGFESGGLAFPTRVLDEPAMYAVIGERRYTDGRWFLDFGIRSTWLEASTDYRFIAGRHDNPVWVCPDCEGVDGVHHKVTIPAKEFGDKDITMKCPKEPKRSWGRS